MAFTNKVVDGGDILLQIDGKVLGCSTSHSIEITSAVREISCKGSGDWTDSEYARLSWSGSTDALFNPEGSGTFVRYSDLVSLMTTKQVVTITSVYTEGGETFSQTGDVVITSINQTAGDSENTTFSVSFQGKGELITTKSDVYEVTVTATGATHVVVEETNAIKAYSGSPVVFTLANGSYNIKAFNATQDGRSSVVVSGADESVTITL